MKTPSIMTLAQFEKFCDWLAGPEAVNVRDNPDKPDDVLFTCDNDFTFTRQYLAKHRLNIEDNIETFKNFGGYCDCEILWNVYDRREKAFPKGVLLN